MFAFGVIAHEMIVGTKPFAEPPVLLKVTGQPITVPAVQSVVLGAVMSRCLDLDPSKRPPAAALASELRATRLTDDASITRVAGGSKTPTLRIRPAKSS